MAFIGLIIGIIFGALIIILAGLVNQNSPVARMLSSRPAIPLPPISAEYANRRYSTPESQNLAINQIKIAQKKLNSRINIGFIVLVLAVLVTLGFALTNHIHWAIPAIPSLLLMLYLQVAGNLRKSFAVTANAELAAIRKVAPKETLFPKLPAVSQVGGQVVTDPTTQTTKSQSRIKKILIRGIILILAVVLAIGLWYGWEAFSALNGIKRQANLVSTNKNGYKFDVDPANGEPMTFLLLGSDKRANTDDPGRSDTVMIAYLPADRKHVYLISVPRDCWVDIPGHKKAKINAAYSFGGPKLTTETLENLLKIPVNHVAIIDFNGFIDLTELLGGITVDNPYEGQQYESKFPKGLITLKGRQALNFVREREDLALGDLARANRQRLVVKAIIEKILHEGMLKDPTKFEQLLTAASKMVTVSDTLSNQEIIKLALGLKLSSSADIRMLQLHLEKFDSIDGQSVDIIDNNTLDDLRWAMKHDLMNVYYNTYSDMDPVGPTKRVMPRDALGIEAFNKR